MTVGRDIEAIVDGGRESRPFQNPTATFRDERVRSFLHLRFGLDSDDRLRPANRTASHTDDTRKFARIDPERIGSRHRTSSATGAG